jgi:hypothetical protein
MSDNFSDLVGKTLTSIVVAENKERVDIKTADGRHFSMQHFQDCCESVELAEVVGDISDLIDSPILLAEEVSESGEGNGPDGAYCGESWTWTFYKLATIKGSVTLRWVGESNGYYSESVYFVSERGA